MFLLLSWLHRKNCRHLLTLTLGFWHLRFARWFPTTQSSEDHIEIGGLRYPTRNTKLQLGHMQCSMVKKQCRSLRKQHRQRVLQVTFRFGQQADRPLQGQQILLHWRIVPFDPRNRRNSPGHHLVKLGRWLLIQHGVQTVCQRVGWPYGFLLYRLFLDWMPARGQGLLAAGCAAT